VKAIKYWGYYERGDQLVVNKASVAVAKTKVPVTDTVTFEKEVLQLDNVTFRKQQK
jgi:hypothetical protein